MVTSDTDDISNDKSADRDEPLKDSGFVKFYGLYWKKDNVDWIKKGELLGQPEGWLGRGNIAKGFDYYKVQMNFWNQKGVYILYDDNLHVVYAGQAGLERKSKKKPSSGKSIGDRLLYHKEGVYRNAWSLFSWFGFLDTTRPPDLRNSSDEERLQPHMFFTSSPNSELNQLLASFEAILIEGFAPRFNARGGDLGKAIWVDQYEKKE
jgi:hypothetical protein